MRPYSLDLRERVAAAVDHQEGSQRQIARRFRVSPSFITRLLRLRRRSGSPMRLSSFDVSTTNGGLFARIVPSLGMLSCHTLSSPNNMTSKA